MSACSLGLLLVGAVRGWWPGRQGVQWAGGLKARAPGEAKQPSFAVLRLEGRLLQWSDWILQPYNYFILPSYDPCVLAVSLYCTFQGLRCRKPFDKDMLQPSRSWCWSFWQEQGQTSTFRAYTTTVSSYGLFFLCIYVLVPVFLFWGWWDHGILLGGFSVADVLVIWSCASVVSVA